MTKVLVGPISAPFVPQGLNIFESNPGVGGTDLRDLQLAQLLCERGFEVRLIWSGEDIVSDFNGIPTLSLEKFAQLDEGALVITRTSTLRFLAKLAHAAHTWVAVSHHPHDPAVRRIRTDGASWVVNVGEYQYWSNWRSRKINLFVPGFCPKPLSRELEIINQTYAATRRHTVGHLSSLHPSKGFISVARSWKRVVKANLHPESKLQVVGGIELYGQTATDPEIPVSPPLAAKIRRALGESGLSKTNFVGVQSGGASNFHQSWAVAVQNPKGLGESDPLSFHELLALGVPIISGGCSAHTISCVRSQS